MQAQIKAMHYCLPTTRLTNQELEDRFTAKAIKSITRMSGVKERRIVTDGITASDLAFVAAKRLLESYHIKAEEIDLIIYCSQTGDHQIPATSCILHHRLKLPEHCGAFDLNQGCSTYIFGLATAEGYIASGRAKKVLLLNAEALTSIIHPQDRGLIPLHGDGAVATLIEATNDDTGICFVDMGVDGSGYKHLIVPASGARIPKSDKTKIEIKDDSNCIRTDEHLYMNGPAVFHFSIYKVPEAIQSALDKWKITIDEIDLVLLHQANKMMLDQIYRKINVPVEKQFYFSETVGNLSGASLPCLLAEAWRSGKIAPDSQTLICAFGAGLSWGTIIIKWPKDILNASDASIEYNESENESF